MKTNEHTHIVAEVVHPNTLLNREDVLGQIISIEQETFGDTAFTEEDITKDFFDNENIFVILKRENVIIGFTYAKASDEEHSKDPSHTKTAFIWDTAISTNFRGRGLSTLLIKTMNNELKRRGYTHVERETSTKNGYAIHISKYYGNRIEIESIPHDSRYGEQVFFRIKI